LLVGNERSVMSLAGLIAVVAGRVIMRAALEALM
jgi:hypothetical protein